LWAPAARISGTSRTVRWAAWLFRVTGQDAEHWFAPLLQRFAAAGFRARLEHVTLPRSVVSVLVAEKTG
jgi:hypothetical protein